MPQPTNQTREKKNVWHKSLSYNVDLIAETFI